MRPICIGALSFVLGAFCFSASAMEIIKIKGVRVLVRLDGKAVAIGEQLDGVDAEGTKRAVVRITRFNETKAIAKIESGNVTVGMRVLKRTANVDSEIASTNNYNIRANPIGLVSGAIDMNIDFRIGSDWTVGVQGEYLHLELDPSGIFNSDYNITAYGFGVRGNWFSHGVFNDGFYFGPGLEYLTVSVKTTDAFGAATGTASGLMASGLVGYGWFWSHFNIMLGAGYESVFGGSSITIKDSAGNREIISADLSGLTLELSMGWAF